VGDFEKGVKKDNYLDWIRGACLVLVGVRRAERGGGAPINKVDGLFLLDME
jgi:hypothetical protein